jgi:hypothetical protein
MSNPGSKLATKPHASRDVVQLSIPDLSSFAKALRAGLAQPPSHVETLNLIARAAGYRNYQHLKARQPEQRAATVDDRQVAKALRYFHQGSFSEWPAKTGVQRLCLWALWAQLPAKTQMRESDISARLHAMCRFRDAAQIRRAMVEHAMVTRDREGTCYQRIEQEPPAEARALIAALKS